MILNKIEAIEILMAFPLGKGVDIHVNLQPDGDGGMVYGASTKKCIEWLHLQKNISMSDKVKLDFELAITAIKITDVPFGGGKKRFVYNNIGLAAKHYYRLKRESHIYKDVESDLNFDQLPRELVVL